MLPRLLPFLFLCLCALSAWSQTVTLTFRVDMSALIAQGAFDPSSETVDVAGTFNQWGSTLNGLSDADGDSLWQGSIAGFQPGSVIEFKFRINGQWSGREEFPGAGNNRMLTVPITDSTLDYVYNQLTWSPDPGVKDTAELAWWNEAVFYEVFVRSFYDSDGDGIGDFPGLTQKLDYLNDGDPSTTTDLGVNALWLMPIHPSPSYHGYDVTDYRGIHPDYGSMTDFQAFLDSAHARGIRVIIDYVMNHSSTQHPWFLDARSGPTADKRNWYRWSATDPGYLGPWGQEVWHNWGGDYYYGLFWGGMPDLNYEEPAVKTAMFDAATFWLDSVGVDGFRLDAVKYLFEDGTQLENVPATMSFFEDFHTHYKGVNPEALTVGEAWTSTQQVLPYVQNDRLDFCFEFDLSYALLDAILAQNAEPLAFQMQRVYDAYPFQQWGSFLTNHDQDRVIDVLGNDLARARLAAGLYLTLPGVPFLYYGEEIGMNGTKPDPDIRRPMQWSGGAQAGFTTGRPWHPLNGNYTTRNVADMQADPQSLWQHYRKLIQARHRFPALTKGFYQWVPTSEPSVYAFLRHWQGDTVLVLANLANSPTSSFALAAGSELNLPGLFYEQLQGSTWSPARNSDGEWVHPSLSGNEVRVYALAEAVTAVEETASATAWQVYPNPAGDRVQVRLPAGQQAQGWRWYDLQGRLLSEGRFPQATPELELALPSDSQGIYLLQVYSQTQQWTVKVRGGE